MGELRRKYGFWGSLGRMQLGDLVAPEILFGIAIGGIGSFFVISYTKMEQRANIAGDYLEISAALTGVVFAGFALVIALMSDQYLRWLRDLPSGVFGFFAPFMVSTGLQVGAFVGAVTYRAIGGILPPNVEPWLFGVISTLFFIAALDIVALARSVLMHGIARSRALDVEDFQARGSAIASRRSSETKK